MANFKRSKKRKGLRMIKVPGGHARGFYVEIPVQAKTTTDTIHLIADQMLAVTPATSILVMRALQLYLEHLKNILADLNDPAKATCEGDLIELQAQLEIERQSLFDVAERPSDYWNPELGRLPSLQNLIGKEFNRDRAVKATIKGLTELISKLEREATDGSC